MNIDIQSIGFVADEKLVEFATKKINKLQKIAGNIVSVTIYYKYEKAETKENKTAEITVELSKKQAFAKKQCKTFEEATDLAVEALKKQIQKSKEKRNKKTLN